MTARVPFVLVTVGAVVLTAAPALADQEVVAAVSDRFTTPSVTIAQGEKVTFRNTDIVNHNVTSAGANPDGTPLFNSPDIGLNKTALVDGTQYLTTGSYPFICTIHPFMKGTLTVSSAGTPVPRPGQGAPGPTSGLTVSAGSVATKSGGRLSLRLRVSAPAAVTLRARAPRSTTTLAKATTRFGAAGARTVTLKPTAAGRSALRRHRSITVTVSISAKGTSGEAALVSKTGKLKR